MKCSVVDQSSLPLLKMNPNETVMMFSCKILCVCDALESHSSWLLEWDEQEICRYSTLEMLMSKMQLSPNEYLQLNSVNDNLWVYTLQKCGKNYWWQLYWVCSNHISKSTPSFIQVSCNTRLCNILVLQNSGAQ